MMKKLVAMVLNWYKRGAKMEICEAGTPQSVAGMPEETLGKSNEEIGTPRKAIETPETAIGAPDGGSERRDDAIQTLNNIIEPLDSMMGEPGDPGEKPEGTTAQPAETSFENAKPTSSKNAKPVSSKNKKPENMLDDLQQFLTGKYEFRYNLLSEQTEYREKELAEAAPYLPVSQRDLNTFCLEARAAGINCWDKDVSRLLNSRKVENYHPFLHYMNCLPQWDGVDRVTPLARRISHKPLWVSSFHRWMLGVAAQWLGEAEDCANAVAPMLVSREQGKRKSSFCKLLMPKELLPYYIDKFDLTSESGCEQKLSLFGLINMDEFDKYKAGQMPTLKNLMQMTVLTFRKAHRPAFSRLPRIASFIGTSNMTDLLTDPTGSRRFICAEVDGKIDCTPLHHAQLFAQLKAELAEGERYWFSAEEEKEIQRSNRAFYKAPAEQELFMRCYRIAGEGEEAEMLTATDIFNYLQKHYPAAMRGVTPVRLGRMMTALGARRIHTEYGNVYRLVRLKDASRG